MKTNTSKLLPEFNAVVLFQNGIWSIEKYINKNTGRNSLAAIKLGLHTYWIVIYEDKKVAYDFPERIPKSIKSKIERFAKNI